MNRKQISGCQEVEVRGRFDYKGAIRWNFRK